MGAGDSPGVFHLASCPLFCNHAGIVIENTKVDSCSIASFRVAGNMDTIISKKNRLLGILITAKTRNQWVPRRTLLKIASRGYLGRFLRELQTSGLIERSGQRGQYLYRATERASESFLKEGPLPRAPLSRVRASERPRGHVVQLRPVTDLLDVDAAWQEGQRVTFQVDKHTGDAMRSSMDPPTQRDRAKQYSMACGAFSLSISRRNVCQLVIKEPNWSHAISGFLMACGLSVQGTDSVLRNIMLQIPDSIKRVEMPVLDRNVKAREMEFAVVTRVGEDKVVSNINYSTNIDWEIYGNAHLVDNWLAALGATQHNQVVALVAMEQKLKELAEKIEELRKEKQSQVKEGEYYV